MTPFEPVDPDARPEYPITVVVRLDEWEAMKTRLNGAIEALSFYADKGNWHYGDHSEAVEIWNDVDYETRGVDGFITDYGGKRARKALQEIGE